MEIVNIFTQFSDEAVIKTACQSNGLINSTHIITTNAAKYVLQRINRTVFSDVDRLCSNIFAVTEHIRAKGGRTLRLLPCKSGELYYKDNEGECWRLSPFVEGTIGYDTAENEQIFANAAAAFGRFERYLADFDASQLYDTIPDFHNTPKRYQALLNAAERDSKGRLCEVRQQLDYISHRANRLSVITDALCSKRLPLRVTHNDTKLNNALLGQTVEQSCVIDLDTVMSGTLLYDYGDAIRYGAAATSEDCTELSQIRFRDSYIAAFTKGYCGEMGESMTAAERALLPDSIWLITAETAIRFLTDYLNGDVYFKTSYAGHNLVRARSQLALCNDFEQREPQIRKLISQNS